LNRSDTLIRKMNHFTQKQFQFKEALQTPIQKRFCVLKGQLYLPVHQATQHIPNWINTARRFGLWGQQIPAVQQGFYRLQRHEWIYPHTEPSSLAATWWTDGLYKKIDSNDFYMYRQPVLI